MHFGNTGSVRSAIQFLNKEITSFTLISGIVLSETIIEIDYTVVNRYISNLTAFVNRLSLSSYDFYVSGAGR